MMAIMQQQQQQQTFPTDHPFETMISTDKIEQTAICGTTSCETMPVKTDAATKHTLEEQHDRPAKRIRSDSTTSTAAGCRRVTCKARGLSKAHKAENAFIEIPDDAPHGLIVSCSHPECGGSGRKFRFCKVCALPVAKRNFLKRHGHGLVFTAQQLKENVDAVYCRVITDPTAEATAVTDNESSDAPSVVSADSVEDVILSDNIPTPALHHNRVVSFDASKHFVLPPNVLDISPSVVSDVSVTPSDASFTDLSNDEKQWLCLFRQRPGMEEQSLTHWMDKVLTVAVDTPQLTPVSVMTTTQPPFQQTPQQPPFQQTPQQPPFQQTPQQPPFQQTPQQTVIVAAPVFVPQVIKTERQYQLPMDISVVDPLNMPEQHVISPPASPTITYVTAPPTATNVPLVEPGMRISEENFAIAVHGIDFATIFDF